jgi:hypothetical protein
MEKEALINQFVLFDTDDGLFIQTTEQGELQVISLDGEKEVNVHDMFPDVVDKELLIECIIQLDPKTMDRSKRVREILPDMLITDELTKFTISYNNQSTTLYAVKIKNGIRKYIKINITDYLVWPGKEDDNVVAPVEQALKQGTGGETDEPMPF